ncbi:MAG TPA: GNAT family N-acetyltransferase [Terriglobia bacterium]|nr:GNAT family N-acetyltransferase [Terriglobia bacterium]
MSAEAPQITIVHNVAHQRFETRMDDEVAFLSYTRCVSLDHTYVPNRFRGKGVAAALARSALNEARKRQWKIVVHCSYIAAFIEHHPEFADLLAP